MTILGDSTQQARRKGNLEKTALSICVLLNHRLAKSALRSREPIQFDSRRHDVMFGLYLTRLRLLKAEAGMADALVNPVKIAALMALCILDVAPLRAMASVRQEPIAAYRNAYLALRVAFNFMGIRERRLRGGIVLQCLNFLTHVPHVRDRSPTPKGTDYPDFAVRFTMIFSFFETLEGGYKGTLAAPA